MIERRVVRRYAGALFSAASKAGVIDRVESDLGLVGYVLESSPDLLATLRAPVVPNERKHEILREVFADKLHEITLSYLYLLVAKHREDAMPVTEQEYVLLANEARGILTAQVTTAVPLRRDEEARLISKLERVTGKSVQLELSVEPAIIGGLLVRIGDTLIDGSIRGGLESIRDTLLE